MTRSAFKFAVNILCKHCKDYSVKILLHYMCPWWAWTRRLRLNFTAMLWLHVSYIYCMVLWHWSMNFSDEYCIRTSKHVKLWIYNIIDWKTQFHLKKIDSVQFMVTAAEIVLNYSFHAFILKRLACHILFKRLLNISILQKNANH